MDKVKTVDLLERYPALNFLFPEPKQPIFKNDLIAVTRAAADKVATVFNMLVAPGRDIEQPTAQRFVLQCVMALFSEDFGLLPKNLFTELLYDCKKGASSYDLIGALFHQMNSPTPAKGGRFKRVPYFNGGLFAIVDPVDLNGDELDLLLAASKENWAKVKPPIFGTLFQGSMKKEERHAYGAHFTSEADINKVISATIEKPWRTRQQSAKSLKELIALKKDLRAYKVLDPACGSGNFLYLAYLQLRRLENDLLSQSYEQFGKRSIKPITSIPSVSLFQFHGIDNNGFAVELAKVTLLLAKEIALRETASKFQAAPEHLLEKELPLDNLDANIRCDDALFCSWPKAQAIIGNPPYQSKNKIVAELGRSYVDKVRMKYPGVPGRADYCVYWFRRAHDELPESGRAGSLAQIPFVRIFREKAGSTTL
jgi:type II restriction/modification system DNA methylase subunit YeeA